jgi:hypothetical protein
MKKYFTIISITLLGTPAIVFAAPKNLTDLMRLFVDLLDQAVVVVGALALLFFFWGLAQLLLNADNEDKKKASKSIMVWGIIILFVMFSIGGILRVLSNTFFGGNGAGGGVNSAIGDPNQPGFIGPPAPKQSAGETKSSVPADWKIRNPATKEEIDEKLKSINERLDKLSQ